jgi:hypothetical protein
MAEKDEYEYFYYFVDEEYTFCKENPMFAGLNLLKTAAQLEEIALLKVHDVDAIRSKASQVLSALCIFAHCNKTLNPLQSSEWIIRTNRSLHDHVDIIRNTSKNIYKASSPHSHHIYMDDSLDEVQENLYTLAQELLGITGLNSIHELMAIAIEMHCNDDILMQRLQHINRLPEYKRRPMRRIASTHGNITGTHGTLN